MRAILFDDILPKHKFHEFFQMNIDHMAHEFARLLDCNIDSYIT